MHLGIEASRLQAHFNSIVGVLSAVGTAAVLVLGVFRVAAGAITPGDLVVFVSYAKKADSPLRHIARESVRIARSMARAERIAEILAAEEVLRGGAGRLPRRARRGRDRVRRRLFRVRRRRGRPRATCRCASRPALDSR